MFTFPCPSGCGKDCPHPQRCVDTCQFNCADLPRTTPRLPSTFQTDYGIEHHTVRRARAGFWLVKWLVVLVIAVACVCWIVS